jgi:hypothetical protein
MGRHHATDDYEDDPNELDESDTDDDDGPGESAETIACPNCGRDVYEFAEQCPKCGHFLTREDASHTTHPRWVFWVTIALLAAMALGGLVWWN